MASGARRGGRGGPASAFRAAGMPYMELEEMSSISILPASNDSVLEAPTDAERAVASLQLDFLRRQTESPYWIQEISVRSGDEKLLRYTDRYLPERPGSASATSFLHSVPLQRDVFPPGLWAAFIDGETRRAARRAAVPGSSVRANIDWDNLKNEERRHGEGEEEVLAESDEEDLGDYEDEEDDDYAQNYFDNGENDDDDGGGGDEAAFD